MASLARRAFGPEAGWGWAVAAQIMLVVMVVALSSPAVRPPEYRALSAARPAAAAAGDVIVIFRPDATEQDLRSTLRQAGARVVDGPTASDAYVLSVPMAERPAALARLAAAPQVVLAQPIDPAAGP